MPPLSLWGRLHARIRPLRRTGRVDGRPVRASDLGLPKDSHLAVRADLDVLYRLVREDKPELDSFKSRAVAGRGRLPDGDAILHTGVSMFETPDQALDRGGKHPSRVVEVTLPPDAAIHVANTLGEGHYSVWGDPRALRDLALGLEMRRMP